MARVTERQAPASEEPATGRGARKAASADPGRAAAAKKPPARRAKASPASERTAKAPARKDGDDGPEGGRDRFVAEQRAALLEERAALLNAAAELQAEADSLAADAEPGDIQFDDESGEGGTTTIDRERDLLLSAQARAQIQEIEEALERIEQGTYGTCEGCGQPIPRARLRAMPSARLCVACKSGGLSRR